jgi:hypothetical protein
MGNAQDAVAPTVITIDNDVLVMKYLDIAKMIVVLLVVAIFSLPLILSSLPSLTN